MSALTGVTLVLEGWSKMPAKVELPPGSIELGRFNGDRMFQAPDGTRYMQVGGELREMKPLRSYKVGEIVQRLKGVLEEGK